MGWKRGARDLRRKLVSIAVASCFASGSTLANPTGPNVVNGTVAIQGLGTNLVQVTNSPSSIINWHSFSIGANEITRFIQQSQSSAVLNRVVGAGGAIDPSVILGALQSNGRVFLINPSGILFGASAQIDVAGLVATSLNLSNADFLAGRLNFAGAPVAGSIINEGSITTGAGGEVYLVGSAVENSGIITSPQGEVVLAAGNSVELVNPGTPNLRVEVNAPDNEARNLGQIVADAGRVGIVAGLINHSGTIRADSAVATEDGRIILKATKLANLEAGSVTSASGAKAGTVNVQADVLVHAGDIRADGPQGGSIAVQARNVLSVGSISADGSQGAGGEVNVQASGRIVQTSAAHLSADGTTSGGKVTLQAADRAYSSGTLTASGQGEGSAGGEVRVLGNEIVLLGANLDASGDAGGGTVLVGGDFQGKNPEIQNANTNQINYSTTINADARTTGDGGKVIVWSDERTEFYGSISVRGGSRSGDGGFIEVSGKENLVFGGTADAGAPNGSPGTLLLDPKYVFVDSAGSGSGTFLLADPNPGAGDQFPAGITALPNGNIVATDWRDDFVATDGGAVYLFNGTTGALISTITGGIAGDNVGRRIDTCGEGCFIDAITILDNGNFLVRSRAWDNTSASAMDAGAVTFGSATAGFIGGGGMISDSNSLIGTSPNDNVGDSVDLLPSGNYLVRTPNWFHPSGTDAEAGAVTFGSGTSGVVGVISASNSLIGSSVGDDRVGNGVVVVLSNGNYVVISRDWVNPTSGGGGPGAGAVTWGSGTLGVTGQVSVANSLVSETEVGGGFNSQTQVVPLPNGNYVVTNPGWNNPVGPVVDAGAVTWVNGTNGNIAGTASAGGVVSAANSLVGTTANDTVGNFGIAVLTNGNYVVSSPNWDNPSGSIVDAGAATWVNGSNGQTQNGLNVISSANSIIGGSTGDRAGETVTALTNGNYVVQTLRWDNPAGSVANVGAVTWVNGSNGLTQNGLNIISSANSLIGATAFDQIGGAVTPLANGNYVVISSFWDNAGVANAGAVTFGSGTSGVTGVVSAANSLVGGTANDQVGSHGLTVLTNGNYVVRSGLWDNSGAANAGAVTWVNGSNGNIAGTSSPGGVVSGSNSLVGTTANDSVGSLDNLTSVVSGSNVIALANGNYVVRSSNWDNAGAVDAGAVTFGSGTTGITGPVSAANSLVGTTANDFVGRLGVVVLANGNYVVPSDIWDGAGAVNAGAATWVNGANGNISGTASPGGAISAANSLVGTTANDGVGGFITALTNGNYVVGSSAWDNAGVVDAGAVTFGNGTSGVRGAVSAANSLVGSTAGDFIGINGVVALDNGNYVVQSTGWDNGAAVDAGAVTFGSGVTGVTGAVSASNSLVGTTMSDFVGSDFTSLANGNYVVSSQLWDNAGVVDAGAVTFGNGTTGIAGAVTAANSLVGTTASDQVGSSGVIALDSGNYVVRSPEWNNGAITQAGAVTFGDGTTGIMGAVSPANSLTGAVAGDRVGSGGVTSLTGGNYLVRSPAADNGAVVDAGLLHLVSPAIPFANPFTFANSPSGTATITPSQITAITNTGTAVTLQANTDITLAAASDIVTSNPAGDGGAITMQAGRSVLINSNITTDNGNLTITANDPLADAANRDAGAGGITMAPGTTLNAGTGTVALTVGLGVSGAASGNLTVENIAATNVNLQQNGRTSGSSIVRASGNSLITATNLLMEVDLDDLVSSGSIGTTAAPMRATVTNLEAHTHEASPGIFIDSPAQGLTVGGVPFFSGLVKGVQNVTSGDISITTNGNLTSQTGTAGCGATGGTGGPICSSSGNITLSSTGSLGINAVLSAEGNLNMTAVGSITQGAPFTVTGTSTINAGTGAITLTNTGNNFQGAVSFTGGATQITDANALTLGTLATGGLAATATGALNLGQGSVGGDLTAASNGGAVTQAGALTVTGTSNITAGAALITLTQVANDFQGLVTLSNTGSTNAVSVMDANTISFASMTLGGNFTVTAPIIVLSDVTNAGLQQYNGNVVFNSAYNTNNNAFTVTGTTTVGSDSTISAGTGAVTLTGAVNSQSGENNSLTVNSSGATIFGSTIGATQPLSSITTDAGGTTSLGGNATTTGAQTFNDATSGGTLALTSTGGGAITATNAANDFTGTLSLSGGTVQIADANALTLGALTTGAITSTSAGALNLGQGTVNGSLAAASNGGTVTQTAPLTVTGTSSITAGAAPITLTNAANDFQGLVTLSNSGATNAVTIADANTISFAPLTLGGAFTVTAPVIVLGDVTNTGAQQYNGDVTFNSAYTTNGGNFAVTGTTTAGSDSTISAGGGNVTLNGAVNSEAGENNSLTINTSGATTFGGTVGATQPLSGIATDAGGTTNLGGNVTTKGAQVFNDAVTAGALMLASTGGGDITAMNPANDFTGTLGLAGGTVQVRDANALTLGPAVTSGALTVTAGGALTLDNGPGIVINNANATVTATGNVNVGRITAGSGTVTLTSSGGSLVDTASGLDIVAGNAVLTANIGNIGTAGDPLETSVLNLSLSSSGGSGQIGIINAGSLMLNSLVFNGTSASIATTGSLGLGAPISNVTGMLALGANSGMTIDQGLSVNGDLLLQAGTTLDIAGASVFSNNALLVAPTVSIGNASLTGPSSAFAGNIMSVSADTLNVTGGADLGGNASLRGGSVVDITSNTAVNLTANGGTAIIEAGSPLTIQLSFPLLASGGFFVNGVEGAVVDPAPPTTPTAGFFANGEPAVLGQSLQVTYGLAPPAPLPTELTATTTTVDQTINQIIATVNGLTTSTTSPTEEEETKETVASTESGGTEGGKDKKELPVCK